MAPQQLRVSLTWGTTVLSVRTLDRGESFELDAGLNKSSKRGPLPAMPDGLEMSPVPVRGAAGGWEIDARGVHGGLFRLRGRDEDALSIARGGVPIPIVPGDFGVLQYGLFSIFFQYTEAPAVRSLKSAWTLEALVLLAIFSSVVLHAGGLGLLRALTTPPPIAKPIELTSPDEFAARFGLRRAILAEPPPAAPSAGDSAGKSGVKDPGARDKKPQGGGPKIAGNEGKFGRKGAGDRTELPGEAKPNYGGLSEVLASDTGEEIKRTLKTINTVSDALSGLNSNNVQLGGGTGTNLRGSGAGGGGHAPAGALFGAGTLTTGWGAGTGGGMGAGTGGAGGAGAGGRGAGGAGRGTGGAGGGTGGGTQEARVSTAGAAAARGGLSPEQVRRVVVAHEGALRACYESEAQRNPNLRGGLTVSWHIEPSGSVPSASVASSTLDNARVEGCVMRQVRAWKFPANDSPTSVTYPFKFGVGG